MKLYNKSISLGLAIHGSLCRNIHFAQSQTLAKRANDPLKLNNAIKYYFYSGNICEYPRYH